jgi:hypothetical protein
MIPRPRYPIPLRRRFVSMFTERLALKALSILLAVVLWFVVAAREPREEYAPVQFAPRLDSALVMRDPAPAIRAHVLGRPSEILKLANAPLVIRRQVSSDSPDTLVMALRPSDVEVPQGVEVIVREVYPDALTLRFEPSTSRRVPVRSTILARSPLDLSTAPVASWWSRTASRCRGPGGWWRSWRSFAPSRTASRSIRSRIWWISTPLDWEQPYGRCR